MFAKSLKRVVTLPNTHPPFKGSGYTINNLFISRSSTDDQALFGITTAASRIEILDVTNASVPVNEYVGIWYASVREPSYPVTPQAALPSPDHSGGLGGAISGPSGSGGSIHRSYSIAYVSGPSNGGGLVVRWINGNIANSYSVGTVSGDDGVVGGRHCAATGNITASYWDTQTSG